MKYMLLIYGDERAASRASEAQTQQVAAAYEAFTKSIRQSGNLLDGDPFQPTTTAWTVRVRDARIETHDGPADTTRQQLMAYYKVQADSDEQASEMAARIPGAGFESIEVRPVVSFD